MDKIDFVITWVDGNDPVWQAEKAKYQQKKVGDTRANRYRDWDFLRYWFRGIEQNAPWVERIYFVTWGHLPPWLDLDNPKLRVVKHSEFIPAEYLPTFSCRPIELNLHRIPGLSEKFVYFNDDMFLLKPVKESEFFRGGLPCDYAVLDATSVNEKTNDGQAIQAQSLYTSLLFNIAAINRHFDKKTVIRHNWRKWYNLRYGKEMFRTLLLTPWIKFTGFKSAHLPYSYLKSTFEEVWKQEAPALRTACEHKFRDPTDVSSRLFSFWQLAKGDFAPRSPKIGFTTSLCADPEKNRAICEKLSSGRYKMACINDDFHGNNFEETKKMYIDTFEKLFPNKSDFERF